MGEAVGGVGAVWVVRRPDGTGLSRIGPYESLDSRTWERVRDGL